ncbi:Hpt domain-containing protein [Natrinema gelatinilyticum]|uniref:Hpt domain-containing protein n=1 Tax=Natrinema gelatinilyticum TaxID=2961571 RepID=UPI0020C4CFF0|nr:Hpt domain-containing protein [Natrinema gelatinilyticum]
MTDYLTDFVQESEERITELNNDLLTLERDPNDEEAMENIFRTAHTLKGNCGAMGLESASDLAHAIEDLLDAIRADELDVTPELMDVVFDAVDELETMIDEVARTGTIETDPSATITALRNHLETDATEAGTGLVAPSADEIDDVCSRFDPPADDGHDVYLTRLAIAEEAGVNNGKLVVDALIDAFDLIGTDPSQDRIAAADYDGRFDAVFGTPVDKAAISYGLDPVEQVDEFEIIDVTDRFEGDDAPAAEPHVGETERGEDITSEEAQNLEVNDLLDEFSEFDDLDEMVKDIDEEELAAFDDMGDAGSFDNLLEDDEVDPLESESGEPPARTIDEGDEETASESEPATASSPDPTPEDGTTADDDTASQPDDQVDDASAVFNELKDEVEMVGFDELQDELAELEFEEFSDEEEVDMDELLGDDIDDDSFLDETDPSAGDVDDGPTDTRGDDEGRGTDTAAPRDDDDSPVDAETTYEPAAGGLDATRASDTNGVEAGVDIDDVETPKAGHSIDSTPSTDSTDEPVVSESDTVVPTEKATEAPDGDETIERVAGEEAAVDDGVTDETDADGASVDDTDTETIAGTDETVGESIADDAETDDGQFDVESGVGSGIPVDDGFDETDAAADFGADSTEYGAPSEAAETEPSDDAVESGAADEAADPFEADDESDLETVDSEDQAETDEETTSESFGSDIEDAFDPTAAVMGAAETSVDDPEVFDDEDGDFTGFDDDGFEDDGFDESSVSTATSETETADEAFETGFDDSFDEQLDDEVFAGTEEFDVGRGGLDSPTVDSIGSGDSSPSSEDSFGDDTGDTDDDSEDDVIRIVEEPELPIPDLSVPEPTDQPDAEAETGEIQSVRVDVDQIDSLQTLVEGLVTSRVRLRHAAEADDDDAALEAELDSLSDLTTDLQETVMNIRLVPLRTVTNRLPRVVRDITREQDKEVDFEMVGEDVELDRSILDRIGDPLIHLVRNAVDHGIEGPEDRENADKPREGIVRVHAERSRDRATITVTDDGCGLDPDRLRSEAVAADIIEEDEASALSDEDVYELIFHSGLSTAAEVTDVSGRGVGMDVVKRTIEDLDGTISIDSELGEGTTVTMQLPVSVAIDEILFVESGGEEFGVPTKVIRDIESAASLETVGDESVLPSEDGDYPVIQLADVLETPVPGMNGEGMVVRIRGAVREVALHCDYIHGQQEVVVKPYEGFMSDIPGLSGATVRGRGEVVNILDVTTL